MKIIEYDEWIKFRISKSQLEALREEAANQRVGVSALIRSCIDQHLDPEMRLKHIINNRDTELMRLSAEVVPQLDEMERQEYFELASQEYDNTDPQVEWLKAKKNAINDAARWRKDMDDTAGRHKKLIVPPEPTAPKEPELVTARVFTEPTDSLFTDELLDKLEKGA